MINILMISWPEKCLILSTFETIFKPILTDIKQKIHNPTFVCSLTILGGSIFKYNHHLWWICILGYSIPNMKALNWPCDIFLIIWIGAILGGRSHSNFVRCCIHICWIVCRSSKTWGLGILLLLQLLQGHKSA